MKPSTDDILADSATSAELDGLDSEETTEVVKSEPVKRGRGRPRKVVAVSPTPPVAKPEDAAVEPVEPPAATLDASGKLVEPKPAAKRKAFGWLLRQR